MKKEKVKVSQTNVSAIFRYIRTRGIAVVRNQSPYKLARILLARDGKACDQTKDDRAVCMEHIRFIWNEGNPAESISPKKEKRAVIQTESPRFAPADALTVEGVRIDSDAFLKTYAWRRLRMEALKLHGARCQCCGASPANGAVMNVDHIKPRKFFPELALRIENMQILCADCNAGKGNWDETDWRPVA